MTDDRQAPYTCKHGHPMTHRPSKQHRCLLCKRLGGRNARERRKQRLAEGRCKNGHDLTLPNAIIFKGKHWHCVECGQSDRLSESSKLARARLAQHARIRDKNNPDAPMFAYADPSHNYTGALTEALLQLQSRLESAMPWERERLKAEIARLAGKIDRGMNPADLPDEVVDGADDVESAEPQGSAYGHRQH